MSARQVRVFATPVADGRFKSCITDAEDVNITLYFGTTKRRSATAALHEARCVARLRGWAPR